MSFSFDRPATGGLGYPVSLRHAILGVRQGVPGPPCWRIPVSRAARRRECAAARRDGCWQGRGAHHSASPVRAVLGAGRGKGLPVLHLDRFVGRNALIVLGEPVGPGRGRGRSVRCGSCRRGPPVTVVLRASPPAGCCTQSPTTAWPRSTNRHRRPEGSTRRSTRRDLQSIA